MIVGRANIEHPEHVRVTVSITMTVAEFHRVVAQIESGKQQYELMQVKSLFCEAFRKAEQKIFVNENNLPANTEGRD